MRLVGAYGVPATDLDGNDVACASAPGLRFLDERREPTSVATRPEQGVATTARSMIEARAERALLQGREHFHPPRYAALVGDWLARDERGDAPVPQNFRTYSSGDWSGVGRGACKKT